MKVSISNIALKEYSFEEALPRIKRCGIDGLELAPNLLFKDPLNSSAQERKAIQEKIQDAGLEVVGLHSLFFNCPDLQILSETSRLTCIARIKGMAELCRDLGGKILTLGAPKNRKKGELEFEEAYARAVSFFQEVAGVLKENDVILCFEPLSVVYECDFIATADEGARLVGDVDSPHFQMLLDTGSMALNKEDAGKMFLKHKNKVKHIHINDPHLFPPGSKGIDHKVFAEILRENKYDGWLSLEFRSQPFRIEDLVAYAMECYQ